jgi:predicted ribosome quality control (RQC) complex YloA/Tae2 family protein
MFNPRRFTTSSGKTILVGRNSKENGYLTMKIAAPEDLFFHATDFPGSHVILQLGDELPMRADLEDAACLAAYYSKGRDKKAVKVDYTSRKNISRSRKAPAGLVELSSFKSIKVKKAEARINKFIH